MSRRPLEPRATTTTTAAPASGSPAAHGDGAGSGGGSDNDVSLLTRFWWVPWLLSGTVLLAFVGAWCCFRLRRRRRKEHESSFQNAVMPTAGIQEMEPEHGCVVVQVVHAFGPDDMEASLADAGAQQPSADDFRSQCLRLAPGDLLVVEAQLGQWLYGRAGTAEGYFPSDRVVLVCADAQRPAKANGLVAEETATNANVEAPAVG
eukprot:TRINITY_DN23181_c0_g1_i1.p1 TRINITY_DN23181_c0_g1~~TRINITY_DN23181_c0_g1_i1.p1  ORF type:complete len:205 (+),score=47.31 TRINITY_DN23181_c0_g1_i1:113-727(+)